MSSSQLNQDNLVSESCVTESKLLAVSLKMYMPYQETLAWGRSVRQMWDALPTKVRNAVNLAVLPSFPAVADLSRILNDSHIFWGAQDLAWEDGGAFTGEVSPVDLAQLGCTFAETGHAERRRLFGETDTVVLGKNRAAFRNGLTPILCVGETEQGSPEEALEVCKEQLRQTLPDSLKEKQPLVVAYEPVWAIGAANPAPIEHLTYVCRGLKEWAPAEYPYLSTRVIYGGSAGPGLIKKIGENADGLFLGRFAHDVAALESIICEAAELNICSK